MKEILIPIFILIVTCSSINLTSIIISYHSIKADINDIENEKIRVDLLHSLKSIMSVFFSKLLYHTDGDFFKTSTDYKKYIVTQNLRDIKNINQEKVHLFNKHSEEDLDFNYLTKEVRGRANTMAIIEDKP